MPVTVAENGAVHQAWDPVYCVAARSMTEEGNKRKMPSKVYPSCQLGIGDDQAATMMLCTVLDGPRTSANVVGEVAL